MREIGWNVADGSRLALHIKQGYVSFGGGIELEDARNVEAMFERVPQLR